ncbi:MAG: hypothetical protein RLZZ453_802 [Chlamydiota bacterium]|jgi:ribosome biogenesis GTPase
MPKDDDIWHLEEEFHSQDRKQFRKESKRASKSDRSKYKKTDQDQIKKKEVDITLCQKGRVLAIFPEGIVVEIEGKEQLCHLRGSLKQEATRLKNLIAVGDFVFVDASSLIVSIEERFSILSRADNLSRNKEQLIAVNVDQVLITTSVVLPELKVSLIDRYIIAAKKGRLTPVILVNKIDLLEEESYEKALFEEFVTVYRDLGFCVIPLSIKTKEGIDALKEVMKGKTSVFSGQSGVGKSSLINAVTNADLATGGIVQKTKKGSHTTTTTHLIPLEGGGFCIDTPGIRSFGVWDLNPSEIVHYFDEIAKIGKKCRYPDCTHRQEPDCAVQKALDKDKISLLRFASYCALMDSCIAEHKKR